MFDEKQPKFTETSTPLNTSLPFLLKMTGVILMHFWVSVVVSSSLRKPEVPDLNLDLRTGHSTLQLAMRMLRKIHSKNSVDRNFIADYGVYCCINTDLFRTNSSVVNEITPHKSPLFKRARNVVVEVIL